MGVKFIIAKGPTCAIVIIYFADSPVYMGDRAVPTKIPRIPPADSPITKNN